MEHSRTRVIKGRATVAAALLPTAWLFGFTVCDAQQPDVSVQDTTVVVVHASADWYVAAEAPEQRWTGTLRERTAVAGPNTRSGLRYDLLTDEGELPVYDPREDSPLAPFLGLKVEITAKLVDLSAEGFGRELWVGSIRRAP